MNIHDAIMRAAHQIETDPGSFDFGSVTFPDCGTPGCALGWIGHFLGYREKPFSSVLAVCQDLKVSASDHTNCEFYERMHNVHGFRTTKWMEEASKCADALRAYAAKYHAPVATPDWNALASAPLPETVNV